MRLQALILALLPVTLATTCSQLGSCAMCDSAVSSGGEQSCGWCVHTQSCVPLGGLECAFGVKITSKDDCPRDILKGNEYNETFAKTIMLAMSGAAYSSNPQPCLTKVVHGAQLRRQITARCDSVKDDWCSGFTAVSQFHKAIIVGFRGSAGSLQVFLEGVETIFNDKVKVIGGGMVSKYFYDAFDSVWKGGMVNDFAQLTKEYPDYELWITGHSLGGSMAAIASNVIVGSKIFPGERTKVITFGEPRTGDHNFAAAHDFMIPYTYRITHSHDMVPHVPTRDFRGFHHHRYEVWYNNKMTDGTPYSLCLTPDDDSCSDSNFLDTSIDDHLHYFNTDVSEFGERGCA